VRRLIHADMALRRRLPDDRTVARLLTPPGCGARTSRTELGDTKRPCSEGHGRPAGDACPCRARGSTGRRGSGACPSARPCRRASCRPGPTHPPGEHGRFVTVSIAATSHRSRRIRRQYSSTGQPAELSIVYGREPSAFITRTVIGRAQAAYGRSGSSGCRSASIRRGRALRPEHLVRVLVAPGARRRAPRSIIDIQDRLPEPRPRAEDRDLARPHPAARRVAVSFENGTASPSARGRTTP
jgi:hypothetical protein